MIQIHPVPSSTTSIHLAVPSSCSSSIQIHHSQKVTYWMELTCYSQFLLSCLYQSQ
jgi:hypothetical protein